MSIKQWESKGVCHLQIHRPSRLNALNLATLEALLYQLQQAKACQKTQALVIWGCQKSFSAGSDLKEMETMSPKQFHKATTLYQNIARFFRSFYKPSVAAIEGYALGGGLELALLCDLRWACESATLGIPDIPLGFSPSGGLSYLLSRNIGHAHAMELLLTGDSICAKKAHSIGLVSQVFKQEQFQKNILSQVEKLASFPTLGMQNTLKLFKRDQVDFEDQLNYEQLLDEQSFQHLETKTLL